MGQTITEKIFSEHTGRVVTAREIVRVDIDMIIEILGSGDENKLLTKK